MYALNIDGVLVSASAAPAELDELKPGGGVARTAFGGEGHVGAADIDRVSLDDLSYPGAVGFREGGVVHRHGHKRGCHGDRATHVVGRAVSCQRNLPPSVASSSGTNGMDSSATGLRSGVTNGFMVTDANGMFPAGVAAGVFASTMKFRLRRYATGSESSVGYCVR